MGIFLASVDDIELIVNLVNVAYRGVGAGWTNESHLLEGPRPELIVLERAVGEPVDPRL